MFGKEIKFVLILVFQKFIKKQPVFDISMIDARGVMEIVSNNAL